MPGGDRSRGLRDRNGNSTRRAISRAEDRRAEAQRLHSLLNELYNRWLPRQRRGRLACRIKNIVNQLIRIYRQFETSLTQDFMNNDAIVNRLGEPTSPLYGSAMDIHPFSERDSWVVIQNQVAPYCVRRRPPPPPPPPPTEEHIPPPVPEPTPIPTDDTIRERLERFFSDRGLRQRGFFSDSHDIRSVSKLTLILVNLQRLGQGRQIGICSEVGNNEAKQLARQTKRLFNRIIRENPGLSRSQLQDIIQRIIRQNLERWISRYANTSNPGVRRSIRNRITRVNLGCSQMVITEDYFDQALPSPPLLDGF